MMDVIKELVDDEKLTEVIKGAETEGEKQLIVLLLIRNNLKSIKGWVSFFGVLLIIQIVAAFFLLL